MDSTKELTNPLNGNIYNPSVDFQFDRSFYSAYTNYKQKFNKFGAQVGLRSERVEDNADWFYSPNEAGTLKKIIQIYFLRLS